jgi:hypothetical protein
MKLYLLLLLILVSAAFNRPARAQQAAPKQQAPTASTAAPPSGWEEVKSTDWVKEPRRQFTLAGKFLAPLPANIAGTLANPPALLLKCAVPRRSGGEGKFRVGAVVVGALLKVHMVEPQEIKGGASYYPEVSVSYRLDDGKPVDDDWPPRYDKTSAEFDKPIFKKMLRAHTILITLHDRDDHEIRMQFDMPELSSTSAPSTAAPAAAPAAGKHARAAPATFAPLTPAQVAEACGIDDLKK